MDPSISEKIQINLIEVLSCGCIFVDKLILNPHLGFFWSCRIVHNHYLLESNFFKFANIATQESFIDSRTRLAYGVLSLSLKAYSSVKEHSTYSLSGIDSSSFLRDTTKYKL